MSVGAQPASTAADAAPVLVQRHGPVLVIGLNRPDVRNAIDLATAQQIGAALADLDSDEGLRVGVLTTTSRNFCAGMDLGAFLRGERPSVPGRGFAGVVELPPSKPLVAGVEGFALAGGFEIALACDLIVAAEDATFGLPEVRRGLVAAGGGLIRLPERVPYHLAMEWALTGRMVPAREAHEVRLVSRLTESGGARAGALELAEQIAENGPLAVRATKTIMARARDWATGEAFDRQREISEPVRGSADAREGAVAFKQKRPPIWRNR